MSNKIDEAKNKIDEARLVINRYDDLKEQSSVVQYAIDTENHYADYDAEALGFILQDYPEVLHILYDRIKQSIKEME